MTVVLGHEPEEIPMSKTRATKLAQPKQRILKYDPAKILSLWGKGKSIREISETMDPHPSKVFVHRVLTLKFPKQYAEGRKERAAATERKIDA
jgi:hypothetical protein